MVHELAIILSLPILSFAQTSTKERIASYSRSAQEHLAANRPDLAAPELRAIIALDPANADARANLGVITFFQGDYAKAAPELHEALKLRPALWKVRALLGMCEKRLGLNDSARRHLEKAFPQLTEEKLRIQVGLELIEICHESGDLDTASVTVAVLRKLKPEDPDILYTAQRIHSILADEAMLALAMVAPRSGRMNQLIGDQQARSGNMRGAAARYREALNTAPRLPGIRFQLGESLLASGLVEDAEREYHAALLENPQDVKAECRLGEIALGRLDLEAALKHYSRAVQLQPGHAGANLGYAKALTAKNGDLKQAEAALLRAVRAEPFNAAVRYHLAAIYRRQGRAADAQRETSEFTRLKKMKEQLKQVYRDMNLRVKDDPEERESPR